MTDFASLMLLFVVGLSACAPSQNQAATAPANVAVLPSKPLPGGGTFHLLKGVAGGTILPLEMVCNGTSPNAADSTGQILDLDADGNNELVINFPPGQVYTYDYGAARDDLTEVMMPAVPPAEWFQDIDGDGNIDALAFNGIFYGLGHGSFDAAAVRWPHDEGARIPAVNGRFAVADIDGNGLLDILSQPVMCADGGRPVLIFLQTAPRQFKDGSDLLPNVAKGINVQSVWAGEINGLPIIAAPGSGCANGRDSAPHIFYKRDTGAWEIMAKDTREYGAPMGVFAWQGMLLETFDPEHGAYEVSKDKLVEKQLPWKTLYGPNGMEKNGTPIAPMIPWGMTVITIDHQEILLVTHGTDTDGLCSTEGRRRGPELITAYMGSAATGWFQVTGLGDLGTTPGEWHWIDAGMLDGHPALVVGQLNAGVMVFVYY